MTIVRNWIVPQIEPRTGGTPPPLITTISLPNATTGVAYSFTMSATSGVPPYTWSLAGVTPDTGNWLAINAATGVLSGTPPTGEVETVRIQVTDSVGALTAPTSFSLTVSGSPPLLITTTSLPPAQVGVGYPGVTLTATGGVPPYTWTLTGASPNWGRVWGTEGSAIPGGNFGVAVIPQQVETETLVLTVTDSVGATKTGTFSLTVNPAGIGTWFGATLPTPPTQFSTVSSPPAPANTNRGSYYTPGVGGDAGLTLQAALNSAAAATGSNGDVIVLQAGTTYSNSAGGFSLPARSGSGWIYVISSQAPDIGGTGLPVAGTRVLRTNIANMASLRTNPGNGPVITRPLAVGVNFYRFVGLDLQITDAATFQNYVVQLNQGDTSLSTLCQHITFDRCYVAGGPTIGVVHALNPDGNFMEVTECMIERTWFLGSDSQSLFWGNSTGPYKVHNNWLEGIGEGSLPGGTDTTLPSPSMPSDFTITNNHYYKPRFSGVGNFTAGSNQLVITSVTSGEITPLQNVFGASGSVTFGPIYIQKQLSGTSRGVGTYQMSGNATTTVTGDTISALFWDHAKNAVEFKVGQRVLMDSNFFEHAFGGAQQRSAFTFTARNQSGGNPWYALLDFTVTNNVFSDCFDGGMNMLIQDGLELSGSTQPGFRFLFRNNIFILSNSNTSSVGTTCMLVSSSSPDRTSGGFGGHLVFDHNTFVAPNGMNSIIAFGDNANVNMRLNNVVWSNNIWDPSSFRITKGGSPVAPATAYATSIPPQCTQPAFIANVTTGMAIDTSVPAGNFAPANAAAVGYTNYGSTTAAAGYQLASTSTFKGKGVSGLSQPFNSAGIPDGTDLGCDITKLPTS